MHTRLTVKEQMQQIALYIQAHSDFISFVAHSEFNAVNEKITTLYPLGKLKKYANNFPTDIVNGRVFRLIFGNKKMSDVEQCELTKILLRTYDRLGFHVLLSQPLFSTVYRNHSLLKTLYEMHLFEEDRNIEDSLTIQYIGRRFRRERYQLSDNVEKQIWNELIKLGDIKGILNAFSQSLNERKGIEFLIFWQNSCEKAEDVIIVYEKIRSHIKGTSFQEFSPQFNKLAKQRILSIEYAEATTQFESKEAKVILPSSLMTSGSFFLIKRRPTTLGLHFQTKSSSQKIQEKIWSGKLAEAEAAIEDKTLKLENSFVKKMGMRS